MGAPDNIDDFKLCYVDSGEATFTTAPLDEQWGDDWSDAPRDCNAGPPYAYHDRMAVRGLGRYELLTITFSYSDYVNDVDQKWTVEDINRSMVRPWLFGKRDALWAGAGVQEFLDFLTNNGSQAFVMKPILTVEEME